MAKTQKRYEGRPPPRRPVRPEEERRRAARQRDRRREEDLTENQKRCHMLRSAGFEEDNGEDSDLDLPPGICGCVRTECQEPHKNETKKRKEWKVFHLQCVKELEGIVS